MKIVVQPELIERVVFEAARADERLSRRFHRAFARCYDEPDPQRRERAFRAVNEEWFERLGLRERIESVATEFAFIRAHVQRVVVADAAGARGQSAELFGEPGRFSVGLKVYVGLLLRDGDFRKWARHELQHVDDMLDSAFGYDRNVRPTGDSVAAENLLRERYALLWAMNIDARLEARGAGDPEARDRRRREFARAFGHCDDAADAGATAEPFERLWQRFKTERPTHGELLRMAGELRVARPPRPESSVAVGGAGVDRPRPGSPCPLCRFSTFDWTAATDLHEALLAAIRTDFPDWTPADGVCGRCAELYRSRAATKRPLDGAASAAV